MNLQFSKYHGTGNDFILIDGIKYPDVVEKLQKETIKRLCDRHYGIGADGLLVLMESKASDYRMRYFNSDGQEAQMCGNGLRCLALFIRDQGHPWQSPIRVQMLSGEVKLEFTAENRVRVGMPAVSFDRKSLPMRGVGECIEEELKIGGRSLRITALSVGNPHVVIFGEFSDQEVAALGPAIEHSDLFPEGTNIHFVHVEALDRISQRIWERGSGETLACGSGAVAAVAAGIAQGILPHGTAIRVQQPGGELIVAVAEEFKASLLEGEAALVFRGEAVI